ncbi:hypothetical protein ACRAWF_22700 [Streptomyces sp. L7]
MHSIREVAGDELSSSWPPGSTVSADLQVHGLQRGIGRFESFGCHGELRRTAARGRAIPLRPRGFGADRS